MKKIFASALIASAALFASGAETSVPVIPLPFYMHHIDAKPFRTDRAVAVNVNASVPEVILPTANKYAARLTGRPSDIDSGAVISVSANPALPDEGYSLSVHPDTIFISASTQAGYFYAFQTLRQMHLSSADGTLAAVEIIDRPRMKWRGFMLDEGRHFFGKEEVKKILDLMALYKLNRFHWHLTEDQGWRIQIDKWPKLTEVGSLRASEKIGDKGVVPPADEKPYGGYYTSDDIREIVEYARERYIEIVPEIDLPGHTQAMVASYPELLACDPEEPHTVWPLAGVSLDVMNVVHPEAIQMSKDIIDQLTELFPFGYIHLGGDECPTQKWENNELCRNRMKELGSDNYRDLQLDYYRTLQNHIASKPEAERRKLIFWNEVLHGNPALLPDSITIMAWIGTEAAERDGRLAASRGYDVIMTPQVPYYINRRQSTDPREPLTQGKGTETLEKVYSYRPMSDADPAALDKYLGVQANFWSEFVPDAATLEYMMLPRLTAVAEAAWTPDYKRSYDGYLMRLRPQRKMLRELGYGFAPYVFE